MLKALRTRRTWRDKLLSRLKNPLHSPKIPEWVRLNIERKTRQSMRRKYGHERFKAGLTFNNRRKSHGSKRSTEKNRVRRN